MILSMDLLESTDRFGSNVRFCCFILNSNFCEVLPMYIHCHVNEDWAEYFHGIERDAWMKKPFLVPNTNNKFTAGKQLSWQSW